MVAQTQKTFIMKTLDLLQSCVRQGISVTDLGYLTHWLMKDYKNINLIEYLAKINEMLEIKFFDDNNKIQKIVDYYQSSIEAELNNLENQTLE